MKIEILYFESCPNYQDARVLVERVSGELGISPEIRILEITNDETAQRLRFLGSPTIRVEGNDIEPGADAHDQFMLACRVYQHDSGFSGLPDERWLRDALTHDGKITLAKKHGE
jgi:hypothetical protein